MAMDKPLKPGNEAPKSGIYRQNPGTYEVTVDQGERMPPGPKGSHFTYKLVREARHKAK